MQLGPHRQGVGRGRTQRLESLLDMEERWERRLSDNQKQCLAVARVILQKPQWVVLNGAIAGLDLETRQRIETVFDRDLADVGVLNIGRDSNESGFFTRTLRLALDQNGPSFKPYGEDTVEDQGVEASGFPPNKHSSCPLRAAEAVNRRAKLTPDRRPKLTPLLACTTGSARPGGTGRGCGAGASAVA